MPAASWTSRASPSATSAWSRLPMRRRYGSRYDPPAVARRRMVYQHLRGRDITDDRVLAAMTAVPREAFLPEDLRPRAYEDEALAIGHGQTISQPYMVAR